jgi:hypothetical protein
MYRWLGQFDDIPDYGPTDVQLGIPAPVYGPTNAQLGIPASGNVGLPGFVSAPAPLAPGTGIGSPASVLPNIPGVSSSGGMTAGADLNASVLIPGATAPNYTFGGQSGAPVGYSPNTGGSPTPTINTAAAAGSAATGLTALAKLLNPSAGASPYGAGVYAPSTGQQMSAFLSQNAPLLLLAVGGIVLIAAMAKR